jgi:hypothetical protein
MKLTPLLIIPKTQPRRSRWEKTLVMTLNAMAFGLLSFGASVAAASPSIPATTQTDVATLATPASQADRVALFQQAIADDLAGRPTVARPAYDALENTDMAAQVAIPSAINLVTLGKFDAARQAFNTVAASSNVYERNYAQLWQLWLTARTYNGPPQALKKELARMASGMNLRSPSQQALVRLYAGQESVDAVFAAIAALPGNDDLQRRDALTEATFFTGGYLQFVAHNNKAALQLYKREQNQLNSTSLESPLINLIAATLQISKNNFLPLMEPGK